MPVGQIGEAADVVVGACRGWARRRGSGGACRRSGCSRANRRCGAYRVHVQTVLLSVSDVPRAGEMTKHLPARATAVLERAASAQVAAVRDCLAHASLLESVSAVT